MTNCQQRGIGVGDCFVMAHSLGMGLSEVDKLTGAVVYPQKPIRCGFCFNQEQGKNGEIKREWSPEWFQFIAVCRKHKAAI